MKIGIIGAMQVEINNIIQNLSNIEEYKIANKKIVCGKINNNYIFIIHAGIGKVNAAIATEILIEHFGVQLIINSGIAGSVSNTTNILDLVIATQLVQHDMDATFMGYKLGEIPEMNGKRFFDCSTKLISIYEEVANQFISPEKIKKGIIASGDVFVSDINKKEKIHDIFNAIACEMEGAAVAQTAYLNNIPFIIFRVISDAADGSSKMEYDKMEIEASKLSSNISLNVLKNIKESL